MKAYKLTDENNRSRNATKWGENVSVTATGGGKKLCSNGWIHFYTNPLIAVLLNPIHANFESPRLWECETSGEHIHEPLKSGCKTLTTIKEIPLPAITDTQKIAFTILCAKEVCKNEAWNLWADKWISGKDRTRSSASSAEIRSNVEYYLERQRGNGMNTHAAAVAASIVSLSSYVFKCADVALFTANINKSIDFVKLAEKAMTY